MCYNTTTMLSLLMLMLKFKIQFQKLENNYVGVSRAWGKSIQEITWSLMPPIIWTPE